jgi:hypothetical protein
MRTTVDLPDDLFRRAKAAAALRGQKLKDLVEEGLLRVLSTPDEQTAGGSRREPTLFDLMKPACGVAASGVKDLGTNPKHMKKFGRD